MIINGIIRFAYWINGSYRYRVIKTFFTNLLTNSDYPYKRYLDGVMIFLILTSVGILIYEVQHPIPKWMDIYDLYVVSVIFLIEYLLRLWVYNDLHKMIIRDYEQARFLSKKFSFVAIVKKIVLTKIEYISSPLALIDLLAILPAYRPFRILRIFVLFRVFKLLRYTKSINQFVEVLSHKRFELFTLLFLLLFIVTSAGIAIYVFEERTNDNINSLFDALYWALVTISTVGYGDISPVTSEGRVVSMLIIVSGLTMISFMTSVIVSAFSEKLGELKENRFIEETNKNEEFLIICGYGQMAKMFLRQNKQHNYKYVVVDKDKKRIEDALKEGHKAIHEDASRHDTIAKFNIKYANITLLCLTESDIENIYITLNAKSLSKKIKVIAWVVDTKMKKKYELAGVDHLLLPSNIANMMLLTAINQPVMYYGIHAILAGEDAAHIDEVNVINYSRLIGKVIQEIEFKERKLLLLGIQRGEHGSFIFNPKSDTVLEEHDILLLMGLDISIEHFKEQYEGSLI